MKRYARGQFTITYYPAAGIAPAAVAALLAQLEPGAVIEDMVASLQEPHTGTRRLVITYREPIEGGQQND